MKIGVVFPQIEFGNDTGAIKAYAQAAEAAGFSHILAYDHILGANPEREEPWQGPYTYKDPFHEPFLLFSYMAALTKTIEFATGILILPQRETALVAKQAAELDVLSSPSPSGLAATPTPCWPGSLAWAMVGCPTTALQPTPALRW